VTVSSSRRTVLRGVKEDDNHYYIIGAA